MKTKKTNAMRQLDKAKIKYDMRTFDVDAETHLEGLQVAERIQVDVNHIFKTLVLENDKHEHFVFVIPILAHLDMKKAAATVNEKKLQLMPMHDLKKVTGYIRGGCSPIGMKTHFPTVIDETIVQLEEAFVSGGHRGVQMGLAPQDLIEMSKAKVASVIAPNEY
ncbi:Cys-tRNA(Pro) deacylase [Staphylococcus felis]|uniref:Cys-tRNA(Pro) deacylase n=1 Tax=Staphylococcus felis TaxID=46127 RepID=UPI000E27B133|nr:Cys-tRNA(Pro) deacylase [Staphylococcus felis]REH76315.1 Cys-tRNA(Pro) deacylase [Staphylococcus felis]REH98074.1 Cys-tRNA(Pro) deacylase [Staphylococcus felis]REI03222.1 Cys-tRNA(Pro) deacylase [Staphylococcus felis]REI26921.1 Cys-tRNA(Pro) deacylase [Staphylococcus felis]